MAAVVADVVRPPDLAVGRDVDSDSGLLGHDLSCRTVESGPPLLRRQVPGLDLADLDVLVHPGSARHIARFGIGADAGGHERHGRPPGLWLGSEL